MCVEEGEKLSKMTSVYHKPSDMSKVSDRTKMSKMRFSDYRLHTVSSGCPDMHRARMSLGAIVV